MAQPIIRLEGVAKRYAVHAALAGVDLAVVQATTKYIKV